VESLDLSALYDAIGAGGRERPASLADPAVLMALWLYEIECGLGQTA